jgi:hypothetical protein
MQSKAPDHSVASPPTDAPENAKLSSGDPPPAPAIPATAVAAFAESPPLTATVHRLSVAPSPHNLKAEGITVGSPRIEAHETKPSSDAAVAPKVLKGPQSKRLAEPMYKLYPPEGTLPPEQVAPNAAVYKKLLKFTKDQKWEQPPDRKTVSRFVLGWRSGSRPQSH